MSFHSLTSTPPFPLATKQEKAKSKMTWREFSAGRRSFPHFGNLSPRYLLSAELQLDKFCNDYDRSLLLAVGELMNTGIHWGWIFFRIKSKMLIKYMQIMRLEGIPRAINASFFKLDKKHLQ